MQQCRHTRSLYVTRRVQSAVIEAMEGRTLLSGVTPVVTHLAKAPKIPAKIAKLTNTPIAIVSGGPWATPPIQPFAGPSAPFTPAQIRKFYGVDTLSAAGTGDGTGQTVAIIDAYYSANVLSDLNTFSNNYGLPINGSGGFTFTAVGQTGGALPSSTNSGWREETALDVEWVHAMAPKANILLVECNSNSNTNLYAGINYARSVAGVSVVSMSFGGGESSGETGLDGYFTTPAGHQGVTFVASTGDTAAAGTGYPSYSPNVVAVGGTSVTLNNSAGVYQSESAWSSGGGAVSAYEPTPSYQSTAALGYARRAVPDVSMIADPNTGVYIYDSLEGGLLGVGGTSLSAPCFAGLVAIANQQRVAAGSTTYDGSTQTLPRLYSIYKSANYSTDFHDVTTGSNGNAAGVGYDLATGIGTPIANKLVPDLANVPQFGTITGTVFQDNNGNNTFDGSDVLLSGAVVYLDANSDGIKQAAEVTATTTGAGAYNFSSVSAGSTGTVRVLSSTVPGGVGVAGRTYNVSGGTNTTANLGVFPTVYSDATNGNQWTVRTSPISATTVQVLVNSIVTYQAPVTVPTTLTFNFTGAGMGLTVDGTNGTPLPTGGVTLNASSGSGDTLNVLGTSGNDSFVATTSQISFAANGGSARTISYNNVSGITIDPKTGTDAINVSSGIVTIPAGTTGVVAPRTFSTVAVAAGASLLVAPSTVHVGRSVLTVPYSGFSIGSGGTLDLADNDLILQSAGAPSVSTYLTLGRLMSSTAAADPLFRTTLGIAAAGDVGKSSFDTVPVLAGDVLVKYTYVGDANLDGVIDGGDYTRIDFGSVAALTGWANGDFNYDGLTDGSDYSLIDNAFNTQTTPL